MQWFRNRNVRGRPPHPDVLTPAEWRVLEHVRAGRSNPEIAVRLGVSVNTVRTHVSNMLAKLEVADRHALAAWDGEPQEASRVALGQPARGRFALAAPFAWVREAWVGKVAGGAAVVAVSAAAVFVISSLQGADGGAVDTPPTSTPAVTATATEVPPEPTATSTATPDATPDAGADAPPHAPDGRTGDAAIDDLIEALLNDSAAELAQRFAGVEARDWSDPVPNPDPALEEVLSTDEWTARLAAADRGLYAVLRGQEAIVPSRTADIVLAVTEPDADAESWTFAIGDGVIVDLLLNAEDELARMGQGAGFMYERYLVLPPPDALPLPPPGHTLAVRSGDAGLDAVLELLEARDAAGLVAAVAYEQRPCEPGMQPLCAQDNTSGETDALLLKRCGQADAWASPQVIEARLGEIAAQATSLHAIAELPDGYQPAAEHLWMLTKQIAPYRWDTAGIFERDGAIVGLYLCHERAEAMYPPTSFVLAPPANGDLEADRTSGIAVIDETLVALRTGDVAALDALADYEEVGCVAVQDGIGAPPLCEGSEAPGTEVEVLITTQCEGGPVRRSDMLETYGRRASEGWRIHSVAVIGPPAAPGGYPPGSMQVVLVNLDEEGPFGRFLALSFTEQGFANIQYGCAPSSPEELLIPGRAPRFPLPPP